MNQVSTNVSNTSTVTNEVGNAQENNQVQLNIQDLQNYLQIIDYAAEQGIFRGWTVISQVYEVRMRLYNFLLAAGAIKPTDPNDNNMEGNVSSQRQPQAVGEEMSDVGGGRKGRKRN